MNSDNLSLITIYTGPRGSGKTLLQTADMARRLIRSYVMKLRGLEYERIYSNYPVGFMYYPGHPLPAAYLKAEPLNMESLYVFDKTLQACRLYIDEIDQWLDRQEWMTTTQQILSKAVQLIRKRRMSISGTIQNFQWLNSKFQFQTDIVCQCRDAAYTPWGRERSLKPGEVIFSSWMDKSGIMTGYSYQDRPKLFPQIWQTKRFWGCYDTTYEFDPMETSTRYTLKRPQKEIVMPGAAGRDDEESETPHAPFIRDKNFTSVRKSRIDTLVADAVADLRSRGQLIIKTYEMFDFVAGLAGHEVDKVAVGAALKKLGVKKYGSDRDRYNLTPSESEYAQEDDTPGFFAPVPGERELVGAAVR